MTREVLQNTTVKIPEDLLGKLEGAMDRAEKDKKKRKRRVCGTVIAAVLAVGLVLPNSTPAVSQAMSQIPVLGDLFSVVTVRDFHEDLEWSSIDVEIPHIAASDAMKQEEVDKVNGQIDATCGALLDQYEQMRSELQGQGYQGLQISGEVMSDREDRFTLLVSIYEEGADGMLQEDHYTIDKATGKQVHLTDLYDAADIEEINDQIVSQMKAQMAADPSADYFIGEDGFTTVSDEQDFYFDEDGTLVVCFDEMEVAPASMGTVTFRIKM